MRTWRVSAPTPSFRLCCAVFIAAVVLSADAKRRHDEERPEWIAQPKGSDLMYIYVVGHAAGQPSETDAQDAAYQNALQKIAAQIPTPDGKPVPPTRIQRAEVVPGCRYVESSRSGHEAWVQVSYSAAEKKRLQEQVDRKERQPETPSMTLGPDGGTFSDPVTGVRVVVPPGAVSKPVKLDVTAVQSPPPLMSASLPAAMAACVKMGPVFDLGPSGTRFLKPVRVIVPCPDNLRVLARQDNAFLETGYFDGAEWQPVLWSGMEREQGEFQFETDHLTLFGFVIVVAAEGVLGYGGLQMAKWKAVWEHPNVLITPGKMSQAHVDQIKLPDKIETPLKLVPCGFKSFTPRQGRFGPYWAPRIFPASGETMMTQGDANCWDACNYTASMLSAKGDPRFTDFKLVQGKMTNAKGVTGDHAWIEIRIGGKIYVIDTAKPDDLEIIPKDDAYALYNLQASTEWTSRPGSKKTYAAWNAPSTSSAPGSNGPVSNTMSGTNAAPTGWKCPACGSYDTVFKNSHALYGDVYHCNGCGGTVHNVN